MRFHLLKKILLLNVVPQYAVGTSPETYERKNSDGANVAVRRYHAPEMKTSDASFMDGADSDSPSDISPAGPAGNPNQATATGSSNLGASGAANGPDNSQQAAKKTTTSSTEEDLDNVSCFRRLLWRVMGLLNWLFCGLPKRWLPASWFEPEGSEEVVSGNGSQSESESQSTEATFSQNTENDQSTSNRESDSDTSATAGRGSGPLHGAESDNLPAKGTVTYLT